jgi:hypothetical protein
MRTLATRGFRTITAAALAAGLFALWVPPAIGASEEDDMPLPRTTVVSTSIASIGFDSKKRQLDVEFRTGALYRYYEVPAVTFEAFLQATSKGHYFRDSIRERFRFRRLKEPTP